MEKLRNRVFNLAKDGDLSTLKAFSYCLTKDEIKELVSAKTNEATPLVMAACNGHLNMVEYLLDDCNANIEQTGSVSFDGEVIEEAPPLWCAAAAGHLAVVKSLIQHGACINGTTKTQSTPLRAACFDDHFDVVKYLVEHDADVDIPNSHGHTSLMIACYKGHLKMAKYLIEHGADINRKSLKGNTALHDCAESGSLEIMKMLLKHGARMEEDYVKMTPLLTASVTGHKHVVEYLTSLSGCSRLEKVHALELLGSTYVDKHQDMQEALKLWQTALDERNHSQKSHLPKPEDHSPVAAYDNSTEFTSLDQLEDIASDPDKMRMQSLLIRERILEPDHPDTTYYIRFRGAVYADSGNFDRCIILWMHALDLQQRIAKSPSPMIQSSLLSFVELFSVMKFEAQRHQSVNTLLPFASFRDIMTILNYAYQEVMGTMKHLEMLPVADRNTTHLNRTIIGVLDLIGLVSEILPFLTSSEEFEFKQSVYRFVHLNPRGRNGWTPLHIACARDSQMLNDSTRRKHRFPSLRVVELLLEMGAGIDATDYDNNTPLHVSAMVKPVKQSVIMALLVNGAHFDACNLDGKTFENVLCGISLHEIANPIQFVTLKCLAARVVKKYRVPYHGSIPEQLGEFIEIH